MIKELRLQIELGSRDLAKQQEKLRKLGEQIAQSKRKLTENKLLLAKLENQ